jgi:NAD(P)-dependent dehydrogenase (short-subunit alcohol dehydrogenase family)
MATQRESCCRHDLIPDSGVLTVGRLQGKVAIVTGGAGGIGAATARAMASEGASVVIVDIDAARAEQVAQGIAASNGTAFSVSADLSEETGVEAAIRATVTRYGRLDVLHNNAAMTDSDFLSRDTQVTDLSLEVWERTMAVNLRSQMLMCKHAIPDMVRDGGGSIINMSSGASLKGDRTRTAYGVSKAGVNTLTMYVAASHGKQGVRANTIVPGLIVTDAVRAHLTDRMLAGLGRATLTPYVGEPEDVANLVVFLASDESRYITGQMIAIDGGMSAHVGSAGHDDR